jgi:hypothetical protein
MARPELVSTARDSAMRPPPAATRTTCGVAAHAFREDVDRYEDGVGIRVGASVWVVTVRA